MLKNLLGAFIFTAGENSNSSMTFRWGINNQAAELVVQKSGVKVPSYGLAMRNYLDDLYVNLLSKTNLGCLVEHAQAVCGTKCRNV